ncbi:MAG: hypothetical protein GY906_23755 [bacterium]|nr:hypothetical protein [bacterium]
MKVATPFAHHVPLDLMENLRWRADTYRRVIEDPSFAEVIREACSIDPIFYINGFAYTYDPRCEPFAKLPFILYPFQAEGILDIIRAVNKEDLLIEKTRDMGASWCLVSVFEWLWHFKKHLSFLMVSRVEDYVDKRDNPKALFQKIDFIHDNLPSWLMPEGYTRSLHRAKLHMLNPETKSVIDGESTTRSVARGDRRTAILLDEFADVEQGYAVLRSTRDATKCRIFNSTPQGVGNAFHDVRETGIKKLRWHWSIHPEKNIGLYTTDDNGNLKILDHEGYPEDYKPILDGDIRSPWYDHECSRTVSLREIAQELNIDYLGSGHQYFNPASITEAIAKFTKPPILLGDLDYDAITAEPTDWLDDESGRIKLWCLLDGDNKFLTDHKLVMGVDVSAGTGASNSVIVVCDVATNEKLLEYASPYIRPEELAKQAYAICQWMQTKPDGSTMRRGPLVVWEINGPGQQFYSRLAELGYTNIYLRDKANTISGKITDSPGWASTKETKISLMGEYRAAIEKFECVNRSKVALEECLEYVFNPAGGVSHSREDDKDDPTGAKSNHGDRVMADALAWKGMKRRRTKLKMPSKPSVPVGSLAWRMKMREKMKRKSNRELGEGW